MTYLFIRQYGLFHNLCDVSSCRFCTKFWFAIILLQVTNILTLNILMKALKFLSDISPFCKGHWYSYFGLLVISALGFKFVMDLFTCILCDLHTMDFRDSLLGKYLPTSSQPPWQPSPLFTLACLSISWSRSHETICGRQVL